MTTTRAREVAEGLGLHLAQLQDGNAWDSTISLLTDYDDLVRSLLAELEAANARADKLTEELRQIYVDLDAQYLEWRDLPPVGDEARNFAFDLSQCALHAMKGASE